MFGCEENERGLMLKNGRQWDDHGRQMGTIGKRLEVWLENETS